MLTLLLSLTARAEEPVTAPVIPEEVEETSTENDLINVGIINLSGEVQVPEVIIFIPKLTTQESSVEVRSALIDARLEEAAARK